ncbi:protein of unknown function [Methylorubrum extorquens]|uniref:Activator of Hsp90 ATPase homologue 1/2-like C-terminal domain-containing protein n=1 Tax=Methylorubrum extorquens TaxID=408 RepID=A0A2N9AXV7_METEX|nr:protein of unknown function [Methylorubrum extorquens]
MNVSPLFRRFPGCAPTRLSGTSGSMLSMICLTPRTMMTDTEPAVVLVRTFRATCDKLYQAWTDPVMIQRWLAPGPNVVEQAETDLRVGGRFRLQTRGPDGAEHRISGCYRELEPARRIVQTWIYDGPPRPPARGGDASTDRVHPTGQRHQRYAPDP